MPLSVSQAVVTCIVFSGEERPRETLMTQCTCGMPPGFFFLESYNAHLHIESPEVQNHLFSSETSLSQNVLTYNSRITGHTYKYWWKNIKLWTDSERVGSQEIFAMIHSLGCDFAWETNVEHMQIRYGKETLVLVFTCFASVVLKLRSLNQT